MSFTVGRASLPVDPSSATWNGDTLTIEGWISPTVANDTNQAYAIRQQLLGLVDNDDESVFPCTFSGDPNWDGFYTAESVRVDGRPGLMETQGRMPYTLVLRRVDGYGQPRVEMMVTRSLRTNSHAVTSPVTVPVVVQQLAETDHYATFGTTFTASGGWGVEGVTGGSVTAWEYAWAAGTKFYRFSRAVDEHYDGTASVEIDYGGTYYPMHGVQVPTDAANRWRLTNGITRIYPSYSTGRSNTQLVVETWNGTTWAGTEFAPINGNVSATSYLAVLGSGTGAGQTAFANCRIVRNGPDRCIVRMDFGYYSTTISISYGQPFVAVTLAANADTITEKFGWRAVAPGAPASSTFTGGIKATADDSNGRKFLLVNAATCSASSPSLWVTTAATSTTWQMCADWDTYELSGGTGTSMRDYFLGDTSIEMRIVAR